MLTQNNLYRWERVGRFLVGITALAWALLAMSAFLWRGVVAGIGLTLILTAAIGFCPMCAMAGRQSRRRGGSGGSVT